MSKSKQIVLIALVGVFALSGGYLASAYTTKAAKPAANMAIAADPKPLLAANFRDLDGKPQSLTQWQNKILVVNFWATWCPPCLEEIPAFIKMQQKYSANGVQFVGIALDQKEKVQAFSTKLGINYAVLVGDIDAIELSKKAGNRLSGLPYTVVISLAGKIEYSEMGGTSEAKLTPIIDKLLAK